MLSVCCESCQRKFGCVKPKQNPSDLPEMFWVLPQILPEVCGCQKKRGLKSGKPAWLSSWNLPGFYWSFFFSCSWWMWVTGAQRIPVPVCWAVNNLLMRREWGTGTHVDEITVRTNAAARRVWPQGCHVRWRARDKDTTERGLCPACRGGHPCWHRRAGGEHRQYFRGQHGEMLHRPHP